VISEVQRKFGTIDVLVSNAGIHRRVDPLDFAEEDVDAIFRFFLPLSSLLSPATLFGQHKDTAASC
jgi:NAD(P)-dependent dehydrogenase (short-subunit alcohol dehydrogenase family)